MGQPHAKESKQKAARSTTALISHSSTLAMTGPGLIPSTVRDIVLQSGSMLGVNANYPHYPDASNMSGANRSQSICYSHPSSCRMGNSSPTFPVILRYLGEDVATLLACGAHVCVAVEAMEWKPLPMTPSIDSFFALVELPLGRHNYRFIVDGKEVVDSTQPLALNGDAPYSPTAMNSGKLTASAPFSEFESHKYVGQRAVNTIVLDENALNIDDTNGTDSINSEKGWGQEEIVCEESRKYPPILPLHLRYTPLNSPPTPVRCTREGCIAAIDAAATTAGGPGGPLQPENLPLPLSVTINHVYFQRREDHAVVGLTTRHGDKFTTLVYYTALRVA